MAEQLALPRQAGHDRRQRKSPDSAFPVFTFLPVSHVSDFHGANAVDGNRSQCVLWRRNEGLFRIAPPYGHSVIGLHLIFQGTSGAITVQKEEL